MKTKNYLALAFPILLAACAVEPRRIDVPPETRIIVQPALPSEANQLLSYAGRIRKLDAREFAAERENIRNLYQREKSDTNRIKYAMALLLAPVPAPPAALAQDDAELLAAIEPLASAPSADSVPGDADVRALANLLYSVVNDRRKAREQLRETQTRLNVARKEDGRDAETRALKLRIDELEGKLNALKSIDRSVNRRVESPK